MSSSLTSCPILIVQEGTCFQVDNFRVTIKDNLGKFADVDYFSVSIQQVNNEPDNDKLGLLLVGSLDGGLSRELQLRHALKDNSKMLSKLLFIGLEDRVFLSGNSELLENIVIKEKVVSKELTVDKILTLPIKTPLVEVDSLCQVAEVSSSENYFDEALQFGGDYEYLEDDLLEDTSDLSSKKLLLLSYLPQKRQTLETWLHKKHSPQLALMLGVHPAFVMSKGIVA